MVGWGDWWIGGEGGREGRGGVPGVGDGTSRINEGCSIESGSWVANAMLKALLEGGSSDEALKRFNFSWRGCRER